MIARPKEDVGLRSEEDDKVPFLFQEAIRGDKNSHAEFMKVCNGEETMQVTFIQDGPRRDKLSEDGILSDQLADTSENARNQIRNLNLRFDLPSIFDLCMYVKVLLLTI